MTPSCFTIPADELISHYLQSNPGLPWCQKNSLLHPSLQPHVSGPKMPQNKNSSGHKKKKKTPQKQKTHNTKIALKTKGMIKINQSNTTFLKSTAFKDLQMKRSPIYTVHLPKQRSVSCCCQVEPANSLL